MLPLEDAKRLAELIGVLNESKQIKQISYSTPRLLTFSSVPPKLVKQLDRDAILASRNALSNKYVNKMQDLFKKAKEAGKAAIDNDLRQLVHGTFQQARELGYQAMGRVVDLDKFDKTIIQRAADEELKYAHGFIDDYTAGKGQMPYDQRFGQYQNTVSHQFNMAAVQSVPADTLIWWEMSSMEPCHDCPELAANSPYTGDLGDNPLPTVPQAGDTECCGNCRCYLRYEWTGFHIGTEPDMSYEVDEFEGEPVNVDWLSTKTGRQVQQDLNNMYRREAYHRQMMDAHGHGTPEWRYHKNLRDEWNSKLSAYKSRYSIRAVPRANVSDYLAPVDDLLKKGFRLITGPSEHRGEAALLRGLRLTPGETMNISKSSVRMKLANGKEKVFSYGDDAGSSIWVKQDMSAYVHPAYKQYVPIHGEVTSIKVPGMDKYISNMSRRGTISNVTALNDSKIIRESFDDLEKRFGIFKTTGKLNRFEFDYTKKPFNGNYFDRGITICPTNIRKNALQEAKFLSSGEIRYTAGQNTIDGTVRHEVGHFVQHRADELKFLSNSEMTKIREEIIAEYGEAAVQKMISCYATTNASEFFAEAFTMYSKPGYVMGTLPVKIENMLQVALRGKQAVTAAPEILSVAERSLIKSKADDVAAAFKKKNWLEPVTNIELRAETFRKGLDDVIDKVIPDSFQRPFIGKETPISASKLNKEMMNAWSQNSNNAMSSTMKHLTGDTTTYHQTYLKGKASIGYGDRNKKILGEIREKLADSASNLAKSARTTIDQLKKIDTIQTEYTREFIRSMGMNELKVYRGVTNSFAAEQGFTAPLGKTAVSVKVDVSSLSSWSMSREKALTFAKSDGYLLEANVPVNKVFSIGPSGSVNFLAEREVIVQAGGPMDVLISKVGM